MSEDHVKSIDLIQTNGLFNGSNQTEFYTFGTIENGEDSFFSNFRFMGPSGYGRDYIFNNRKVSSLERVRSWEHAFIVRPTDTEAIVDAIDYQYRYNGHHIKLFKFNISATVQEVNTMVDEFELRRKWKALSKLNQDEIKLLGLEKEMVHLKLKYDNVPNDDDEFDVPF